MSLEIDRLRSIRLLALDVDGVLTDARVWMNSNGEWRRFFSIRDGLGMKRLRDKGYRLAIITASESADIRQRAKNLGVDFFYEGAHEKMPAFLELQKARTIQDRMKVLAETIPNGNGRVLLLPGLGHVPHVEAPEKAIPPLIAFLKEGL